MSSSAFRQDMPPPGGYKPIPFERITARKVIGSRPLLATYFAVTGVSIYLYLLNAKKTRRLATETRGMRMALEPMLRAERDRAYLTQLRKNRDEEERLMANVPGWVVGTYYGEPVFKSLAPDEWFDVSSTELFCHADPWYGNHHAHFADWV